MTTTRHDPFPVRFDDPADAQVCWRFSAEHMPNAVARAVVTEVGGVLSHTAVAAREFGIPAVVAVPDATRLLRDGELVAVGGSAGTVHVIG